MTIQLRPDPSGPRPSQSPVSTLSPTPASTLSPSHAASQSRTRPAWVSPPPSPGRRRRWLQAAGVLTACGAALILGAGPAAAHVSVTPETIAPGGYTTLTFRVPNESDAAHTTGLEIRLPPATPFGFVSAGQAPGWTAEVISTVLPEPITSGTVTLDEAVTTVRFTSDDAGLPPHQFTTFDLLVGPVPDVESISFAVTQTYSDGEVVDWDDPTPAGGAEPPHPAPVVAVGGAATGGHHEIGTVTGAGSGISEATPAAASTASTDVLARALGIIGIVVGVLGVGVAVVTRRLSTRDRNDGGGQPA